MSHPKIDVAYIANLARMNLTDEETTQFSSDLQKVLDYVGVLEGYPVEGVKPMNHPLSVMDVMREDVSHPGLTTEEALANAPLQANGQIRVPKVVESA